MPELYVANCTQQNQIVYYRTETRRTNPQSDIRIAPPRQQEIKPGQQIQLGGRYEDLGTLEFVKSQLEVYGACAVMDIDRRRTYTPYIWNIDKKIPANAILKIDELNRSLKSREGTERRKKAAVSVNETVKQAVASDFLQKGIEQDVTDTTEISFEQIEEIEGQTEKPVAEGFRVTPEAPQEKPRRGRPPTRR
jgi:hypothetical protein